MREQVSNKSLNKSPVRIRPPDNVPSAESFPPPSQPWHAALTVPPADPAMPRWLSVEQVRKMQRMRRETVLEAMRAGELPYERRGRICYIRQSDVLAWEAKRMQARRTSSSCNIHPDLAGLA